MKKKTPPVKAKASQKRSSQKVSKATPGQIVQAASQANRNLTTLIAAHARDRWSSATLQNLTPERIQNILRGVIGGSFQSQWELFDLMEDTWPRLKKNLNELKRAVQKVDMLPIAFGAEKKASALALKKQAVLEAAIAGTQPRIASDENSWEASIYDVCDAVGKSISIQEILWEIRDGMVVPRAFQWIYPRHYGYWTDKPDLMLSVSGDSSNYIPFPDDKFMIATFKTKTGHLLTSALLRSLATIWIGANFSYDWALNLAQMFGLPIRWATYDPSNPKLLDDICEMLENMGSAGWGAFPAGTTLELKEAVKDAAHNPQSFLMNLADISADILILGQTLTTSQGDRGSQALGNVHQEVRGEVIEYVATWAAEVFNYQFVPALMRLNFGHNDEDPYLVPDIEQKKDALQMAQRDKILIGEMGLPVSVRWFYERHDIPEPGDDDQILVLSSPEMEEPEKEGSKPTKARLVIAKSANERLVDHVLEDLTGVQARWLGPVKPFFAQLLEYAKNDNVTDAELMRTIEAAANTMPELASSLNTEAVRAALEKGMTSALFNGVSRAVKDRRIAA